jgi:hypothetical protein
VNFVFDECAVAFHGASGPRWLSENFVLDLYEDVLTVTPDMSYGDVSGAIVATSANLGSKTITATGGAASAGASFVGVSTTPGTELKGAIIRRVSDDLLVAHLDSGFDGFDGQGGLQIEVAGASIVVIPSASTDGAWYRP